MGWVNQHSFKHDRKLRRAALMINYAAGMDAPTFALAAFAVWSYVRQHQCNMHGYLKMKPLFVNSVIAPPYGSSSGEDWSFAACRYSPTMRKSDYGNSRTLDDGTDFLGGKFGSVGRRAQLVGGINKSLKSNLGTQLPTGLSMSLGVGTVSIDKNYMAPYFNDRDIAQYLSVAFDRANAVGGSSVPNKLWLQHQLDSAAFEWQVAYASLYSFCKAEFDADAVGVIKTTPPKYTPPQKPTTTQTSNQWKSGLMPTF